MKRTTTNSFVFFLAALLAGSSCQPTPEALQLPLAGTSPDPVPTTGILESGMDKPKETNTFAPSLPSLTETVAASSLPEEVAITQIPLAGPAAGPEAELSGLAWYGDVLVLLPQYPQRISERGQPGVLFALPGSSLIAFLDGDSQEPLVPGEIPLISPDLDEIIPNFEGFEAIAFSGYRVYLTIESGGLGPMMSYLISGEFEPNRTEFQLDAGTLQKIPPQADLLNRGEEALVSAGDRMLSLFETNGAQIVPDPVAHQIDLETLGIDSIPFPNVEYRITDATPLDSNGRFWALNTFFPGDFFIFPENDPIAGRYGQGVTHAEELAVERLLQFQFEREGITLAGTPPVQLQLLDSFQGRNWEGLAELPGRGFLLVTDQHPETILAFLPYP